MQNLNILSNFTPPLDQAKSNALLNSELVEKNVTYFSYWV